MRRNNRRIRRNTKSKQMTPAQLRRFVMKEAAKLSGELEPIEKVSAEEVDAGEYAETLEHDLDIYKAMKIKEEKIKAQHRKIVKEARRIRALKNKARKKILRNLK